MWGVSEAAQINTSAKLKAVFGSGQDIEVKRVYGSITSGTGRWLAVPDTTHPGDHLSTEAIADAITWMNMTLAPQPAEYPALPAGEQIWYWKELGTLIALIGGVLVLLGSFELILQTTPFSAIARPASGTVRHPDGKWWALLALTTTLPAATYFPLTALGAAFTAGPVFPQAVTNQILVWALANAALALLLRRFLRRGNPPREHEPAGNLTARLILSLAAVGILYVAVLGSDWLFRTDMRFWVVALKPMAAHHLPAFLAYLIPFTLFFHVTQRIWQHNAALEAKPVTHYAASIAATVAGLTIMVIFNHAFLLTAGRLPGVDPLFSIVAIQFVPVLAITSIVSVFTWRRTDHATAGALISGLFVTRYIVAG